MNLNVISIDGPAASGKSTIAKRVAEKIGATYINTGNMYRAVTLLAIKNGYNLEKIKEDDYKTLQKNNSITYEKINGELTLCINSEPVPIKEIRSPEVTSNVSYPSASKSVREWLVAEQRKMIKFGLIIMEGRDIGTNVFPDAKYKFYLTSSPLIRAQRRLSQKEEVSDNSTVESVAKEIALRDELDSNREIAPLKKADDATLVDNSYLEIEQTVKIITDEIKSH